MKFIDLYDFSNNLDAEYTSSKLLILEVEKRHCNVDKILLYSVDIEKSVSLGHIKLRSYRQSPYGDMLNEASIRYDKTLNRCWQRLVVCKELMHVFDNKDERVDTDDKFKKLMSEFDSPPLAADSSPMYQSELRAQWMAIACLVPRRLKNFYTKEFLNGNMTDQVIATKLKIPKEYVSSFVSPYYDVVLEQLLA